MTHALAALAAFLLAAGSAGAGDLSVHRPNVVVTATLAGALGCEAALSLVRTAARAGLKTLGVDVGYAHLGTYAQLPDLLIGVGVSPATAQRLAVAVFDLHAAAFASPALRFTAEHFVELTHGHDLMLCLPPYACGRPEPRAGDVISAGVDEKSILILHPPFDDPSAFALNLLTAVSAMASERFLANWAQASEYLSRRAPELTDRYWPIYRTDSAGAFADVFVHLYQTAQVVALSRNYEAAPGDRDAWVNDTFRALTTGPHARDLAPVVGTLDLAPETLLVRADAVIATMERTIRTATLRMNRDREALARSPH